MAASSGSATANAMNKASALSLTSRPPTSVPSSTATTAATSIQPLAATSLSGPTTSVTSPYLAGAYNAAPVPTTAKAASGCSPASRASRPTALRPFIQAISRALGMASASGPANGASST